MKTLNYFLFFLLLNSFSIFSQSESKESIEKQINKILKTYNSGIFHDGYDFYQKYDSKTFKIENGQLIIDFVISGNYDEGSTQREYYPDGLVYSSSMYGVFPCNAIEKIEKEENAFKITLQSCKRCILKTKVLVSGDSETKVGTIDEYVYDKEEDNALYFPLANFDEATIETLHSYMQKLKVCYSVQDINGVVITSEESEELPTGNNDFCTELNFILKAMDEQELGEIVDYNKPLGITGSWYPSTVELTGFTDLVGQSMWTNLFFNGNLINSDTPDNEKLYKDLLKVVEGCLTGYEKQKSEYETGVKFFNKKNENLYLEISYYGKGKSIELNISRY